MKQGLQVRGLRASYRRGPEVVRGVDLDAARGSITALLGPNGSGKSTLLKALVGLVGCRGRVALDGEDLQRLTPEQRAQRVAYVPQRSLLSAPLLVHSVVAQGRFPHRRALSGLSHEDQQIVDAALHEADIAHLACRPFTELSGGEQQRVLLARALATGADVVLMDEPTSAQDVRHALELHAILRRLRERGAAILVCLHDLSEVRAIADRAVLLECGSVHAHGPAEEIVHDRHITPVYGVELIEGGGLGFKLAEGGGS
jgi:iron complex transport system ATP-binding protein